MKLCGICSNKEGLDSEGLRGMKKELTIFTTLHKVMYLLQRSFQKQT